MGHWYDFLKPGHKASHPSENGAPAGTQVRSDKETLKGAAKGAAAGFVVGGPVGAVIGAGGGGYMAYKGQEGAGGNEKANLEEQRQFKNQMLAALQARLGSPLQAPQLGAPAWMGYQTPLGPGTQSGSTAAALSPLAPVASRVAPATGFAGPPVNPMQQEIERIRQRKMLEAFGVNQGLRLG